MANCITGIRILCSLAILFCEAFSPVFYALYVTAGITDMIDGAVARRTNTVSEFGSKLDTAADFALVAVCLIKLLPALHVETWLYLWIAAIAVIKVVSMVSGYVRQKKLPAVYSLLNKLTGALLFALPLTLRLVDFRCGAVIVCVTATAAAMQEGYLIRGVYFVRGENFPLSFLPEAWYNRRQANKRGKL